MPSYLESNQVDDVEQAVLTLLGYDPLTRTTLLDGLPIRFRSILPAGAGTAAPAIALRSDLGFLNTAGRLEGGIVPIKVWLQNVLRLIGTTEAADPVREAIADIETDTTGAPRAVVSAAAMVKEKIVLQDDMVTFGFMQAGVEAARAVGRLAVPRYEGGAPKLQGTTPVTYLGTGWLIAPGLLVTNHHVVNARDDREPNAAEADLRLQASKMEIRFDFDADARAGTQVPPLELVAWDAALDYALIRVQDGVRKPLALASKPIAKVDDNTAIAVNIIQHPDGKPKRYGIRNNLVSQATQTELQYFTDTLNGSSGAPVMNDQWEVVALHRGSSFVQGVRFQGRQVPYVNVGTPMPAIMADLRARYVGKLSEMSI